MGAGFAAANGLAVVVNGAGVFVFGNENTVIAESNRIVEVDSAGSAVWACDSTRRAEVTGGPMPTYDTSTNPDASKLPGHIINYTTQLSNPRTVIKLPNADYVVADSGNNRVVQFNRAGQEVWLLDGFSDPLHLLPAGAPTTLSSPQDFSTWQETTKAGLTWVHYLIADTGNYRVLDIVSVYKPDNTLYTDANGTWDKVLYWVTEPSRQGKRNAFATARRIYVEDSGGNWIPKTLCTVSNLRYTSPSTSPSAPSPEAGGSIAIYSVPALTDTDVGRGSLEYEINSMVLPDGTVRTLSNPAYVDFWLDLAGTPKSRPGSLDIYKWLIVDEGIVYMCSLDLGNATTPPRFVVFKDPYGVYGGYYFAADPTTHFDFRNVTCARRLSSGHLLIVDNGGNSVLEIDPYSTLYPRIGDFVPVTLDSFLASPLRRARNTQPVEKPFFADRTW